MARGAARRQQCPGIANAPRHASRHYTFRYTAPTLPAGSIRALLGIDGRGARNSILDPPGERVQYLLGGYEAIPPEVPISALGCRTLVRNVYKGHICEVSQRGHRDVVTGSGR